MSLTRKSVSNPDLHLMTWHLAGLPENDLPHRHQSIVTSLMHGPNHAQISLRFPTVIFLRESSAKTIFSIFPAKPDDAMLSHPPVSLQWESCGQGLECTSPRLVS